MRTAHPTLPSIRGPVRRLLATGVTTVLALTLLGVAGSSSAPSQAAGGPATSAPAAAPVAAPVAARAAAGANPVTPGHFNGYAFDQCLAPTQRAMDAWLVRSPFMGVGIYISGDSRACRNQPNLTPTWVSTQLRKGWRLLPIILGPQASCQPRFPRYRDDFKISPDPGSDGMYRRARTMGRDNANESVADAKKLGLTPGSTLWYDLEGFDNTNRHCRESALAFLSAWSHQTRRLGFVAGVYSSAGSGILELDRARINRRPGIQLPDRIWFARWDEVGNTSTSYLREDGWRPGNRMKQFRGGHDEVWGGVRINIDSNRLALGRGAAAYPETNCGGVRLNFPTYPVLNRPSGDTVPDAARVKALQCLLQQRSFYRGKIHGRYDDATVAAARAYQKAVAFQPTDRWGAAHWVSLLSYGARPVVKFGVAGPYVRRIQRALNAVGGTSVKVTGLFDTPTHNRLRAYQKAIGTRADGIVVPATWSQLRAGRR